ncbi:MAG: oligoendopeptidase F [candidate division Zixibacteria bacterium]|nr:oligoendopeptidase F [candidate division Zixibacteria bacterium]MDH3938108.1 oligoendopeptidase F [candidate division Zixibacteria bacterium]
MKLSQTLCRALLIIWAVLLMASLAYTADDSGIPQRSDIDDKYKWRVEDIYETPDLWEADFQTLKSTMTGLQQYQGHLGDSPKMLYDCLTMSDELGIIEGNLYVYAYLKLDEDNRSSVYQELAGRIQALSSQLSEATSFIEPELLTLDEAKVEAFMKQEPKLELYRFYLEDQLRRKAHILSQEEEAIIAALGPVARAPSAIFQMIDAADLKLGTVVDGEGDTISLTWGRYARIMEGPDRELRSRANDTVQASYLRYINTLGTTFGASLDKDWALAKIRGYETCLNASLDDNNIPTSVFHNLVKTVNDNIEVLHKWTRLRKKILGFDTLYTYDLSVPLGFTFDKEYTYEECVEICRLGLAPMGEQYVKDLTKGFESGWIDAYETEGKGTGGYCWGTYKSHPYILMNFSGRLDDLFTLAHEMGHALNAFYANKTEPYIYHGQTLFTAEVASTCNEALVIKYLLANAESKQEKLAILNHYIKLIQGTFFTQVMFAEFELAVHDRVESGEAVSVDYFRKTYRDIYQKYNGPELVIGENNDMSGMKIPHFYRQYYVYQYATGIAAGEALSQAILEKGKPAVDAYMKFLSTGSSKYPVDILKDAGVDITNPEPVERTIKLFGELVDQMEALLNES